MRKLKKNELSILLTAVVLGILIAIQAQSFQDVSDVITRNSRSDVFREIQILKDTNDDLEDEIDELEGQLDKITNNQEALDSVREEIEKYEKLTGRVDVSGPGINVKIDGDLKSLWLIDVVNELFTAGAEAVSVNSIRLTNNAIGFDTIPNGQILLNGVILNQPYTVEAIGDKEVLEEALNQPQGIVDRMTQSLDGVVIVVTQKDLVEMEKVF
jgi:uncharacterized protein YlxW (UPF0749 family)